MGDDLTGLSEEEIAAIEADTGEEDTTSDDKDGDDSASDAGGETDTKPPPEDKGAAEDDSDTNSADEGDKGEADADKDTPTDGDDKETKADPPAVAQHVPFTPQFATADEDKLKELKESLDSAKKQFDEGEIDFAKFSEVKDVYNENRWKADFAKEANSNLVDERWKWEQDRFLDENQKYRDNSMLNSAFVSAVNTIVSSEAGEGLGDREVLQQAMDEIEGKLKDLGVGVQEEKPKDEKKEAIKAAKKSDGDRTNIPKDLNGVPAASDNDDKTSEFAQLDKLSGEKFQEAIDKMTPAQLAKYEDG